MQDCPSCGNALSERGSHCPSCGVQARCKVCREVLDLGARFCVGCGTPVGEGAVSNGHSNGENGVSSAGPAINLIRFHQDNRICDLDARLTDRAFEAGGEVLGLVIAARAGVQVRRARPSTSSGVVIDDPQLVLPGVSPEDEKEDQRDVTDVTELPKEKALPSGTDGATLRQIFRYNEDKLKLINTRIKATKQEDFVARLSVLFLYAHELENRENVSRADLNEALEDAKVYNGATRGWIANSDLLAKDGDRIGLSVPGREHAVKLLEEFRDVNIQPKWTLSGSKSGARTSKSQTTGSKTNEGSKQARGRRARGTSYFAHVSKLASGAFLKKKHTSEEVHAELVRLGHKFLKWRVNEALVKLTKSDVLTRDKNAAGDWVYQSKEAK